MPWAALIELILFVLKLIFKTDARPREKMEYLRRWRVAQKKAKETGDTSDLENLATELSTRQ